MMKVIFVTKEVTVTGKLVKRTRVITETRKLDDVGIQVWQNYYFEENVINYVTFFRKVCNELMIKTVQFQKHPVNHAIFAEKKNDVEKFLGIMFAAERISLSIEHFQWYTTILNYSSTAVEQFEELCKRLEEDVGVRI